MATSKTIHQLNDAVDITANDEMPFWDVETSSGEEPTIKITLTKLANAILSLHNLVTGVKGNSESNYRTGNVNITKANIGLGNVDNTSDTDKPISTATQTELDAKANNATTLAGYGITDAYTKTQVDNSLALKLDNANVYNGLDKTASGYALDARQGKVLGDAVSDLQASVIVEEITTPAAIMSFPDGAAVNARDLVVGIEPVQSGSGDPSPTNVRPINGWTGAKVTRCGKNFAEIDSAWIGRSGTHNGITWRFNEDGSMTLNGTKTTSTPSILIWNCANAAAVSNPQSDNKKHIPNGDYYIYSGHGKATVQVYGSNDENAGASNSYYITSGDLNPVRFTINDTYKYNWIRLNIAGSAVFDNYTFYPMVRLASDTGTEQAPYTGATYDIAFPASAGTVYSGTLDVTTGLLTRTMANVDLGTLTWAEDSGLNAFISDGLSGVIKKPATNYDVANCICENYVVVAREYISNKTLVVNILGRLCIRDTAYTDAATFKAAMSGVQLVYELATPQTYQLTPTQVALLLGQNNIWADTGDVQSVQYQADTKRYIDKKIAALA